MNFDAVPVSSTTASSTGSWSAIFVVPVAAGGPHTVAAVGSLSGTATANFTVIPRVTVFQSFGNTVIINGYGFTSGDNVTVTVDGVAAASMVQAGPNGSWGPVSTFAASGNHTIIAFGTEGAATTTVTVIGNPTINGFTPTSAGNGGLVTITGSSFSGITSVSFGGIAAKRFILNSDTQITAEVDTGASGSVSVTNYYGTAIMTGFTFVPGPITTISIGLPSANSLNVMPCGIFDVNINVDQVTNLNAYNIDLTYDATIIQVVGSEGGTGVTDGLIGGAAISMPGWAFQPNPASGDNLIIGIIPGASTASGTGYLAQVHFSVLGAAGQSSTPKLFNQNLVPVTGLGEIPSMVKTGSVNVVAGSTGIATKLSFTTSPSAGAAGSPFSTQPVVTVQDASGNIVTDYSAQVTLAITSVTGLFGAVLNGTTMLNAVHGVATFKGWGINLPGNGYTLTATASTLTTVVSQVFNVYRPGDVNLDGKLDVGDIVKLERIILGLDPETCTSNANRDELINVGDVIKIERIILGLDP